MAETKAETGSFMSDLRVLLESSDGADVILAVGDSELPAHSVILAARSPVFAAMLRNDMQEARTHRIQITDMREDVLRQVLSFIYTDTAPLLGDLAAELLVAADKYDLPLLKKRCEDKMAEDVSVENAADTVALAVLHRCPGLMDTTLQFIAGHPRVMDTVGWAQVLQKDAQVAVEICKRLSALLPSPPPVEGPTKRILTEEHKQILARRLVSAASSGDTAMVLDLLEVGAPVNGKAADGDTALHKAAANGYQETVKCLIHAGADVNVRDSHMRTPLHRNVVRSQHLNIIWMLVGASAHVDVQDNLGQTPLHLAVMGGHEDPAKALLLAGARKDVKDNKGKTPADMDNSYIRHLVKI